MPVNEYALEVTAQISIGGTFQGETKDEAIEVARQELRAKGEISNIDVVTCIYLDREETNA